MRKDKNIIPHIVDCLLSDNDDSNIYIKLGEKADSLKKKLIG